MVIQINTEEALNYSLSIQDCAVLDVVRKLINEYKGAIEVFQNRQYKWLSDKIIMQCLQCPSFRSCRQLYNILKKLVACGLLKKRMYLGKPYYCDIKNAKVIYPPKNTQAPKPTQAAPMAAHSPQPSAAVGSVPPSVQKPTEPEHPQDHRKAGELSKAEIKQAFGELDKKLHDTPPEKLSTVSNDKIIPSAQIVNDYAQEKQYKDFDTEGFISYNSKRNWKALNKFTWKQLFQQWYYLQKKHTPDLITYEKYLSLIGNNKNEHINWCFDHKDPRTGVTYFRQRTDQEKADFLKTFKRQY